MSKFKALSILLGLCSILYFSCQKDNDEGGGGNPPPTSDLWGSSINISICGRVLDQNGDAVSGAQVNAGSSSTTTDAMGVFVLNGVSAFEKLGYVKVEKAGYFPGSRSFVPGSSAEVVEIHLLTKTPAGTVSGSTGGTVVAQGVSVELAPNSVVKSDNTPHTGNVRVFVANIDPTDPEFNQEMPGNLIAVQNSQPQGLTSFGMVAVELSNNSGQPLQLAQGQTATVKFPIATGLQASAPTTIDLWSFDEDNGYWKHEGQATRNNNEYIAQVSHFSFWNCDVPWDMVFLEGTVRDPYSEAVQGATVSITGSNVGSASDITNAQGLFAGYVPANMPLNISVAIDCGGTPFVIYIDNIGPLSSNTTLNPIAVTPTSITTIIGTVVDCNNNPLNNSYLEANGQVYFAPNGQFSFQTCGLSNVALTPHSIYPWVAGNTQTVAITGAIVNAGGLQACNSGGVGTGIYTDLDGNTYDTLAIGSQVWMKQNLKVTKFRNGDQIPNIMIDTIWQGTVTGAYCAYNNSLVNDSLFGKLYNWYAVADPRGLCPSGWHVPTDSEWNILIKTLDPMADTAVNIYSPSQITGGMMKSIGTLQAGTGLWEDPNFGATNSSGFTGLPGGYRAAIGGFAGIGTTGQWWTSTRLASNQAWFHRLNYSVASANKSRLGFSSGMSVRCIRD